MRKYIFLPFKNIFIDYFTIFFIQQSNFCWNNTSAWNFEIHEYVNRQPPGTWLGSVLFLLCCYDWYASFTLDFSIIFLFSSNWTDGIDLGENMELTFVISTCSLQVQRFPLAVFLFLTLPSVHWSREADPGFYGFSQLFE